MTSDEPRVAAIVLAAGQGTRFAAQSGGAFKLLAEFRGQPLVKHVVTAALDSRARPIVVVTGHQQARVEHALAGVPCGWAHNAAFATGLASSLKAGMAALPDTIDGTLVLLADMPRVSATLLDDLIAAFASNPTADAVVPVHDGRRGNPALLSRKLFPAIAHLDGDEGARRLLRKAAHVIEVPVRDDAVAIDIDTPDGLAFLERR